MLSFKKHERLRSRKRIENLFTKGKTFTLFPFKIFWFEGYNEQESAVQVLINVPKKQIKKAVARNKLRRRIKEAYRLQKEELYVYLNQKKRRIILGIIYIDSKDNDYTILETKLIEALQRLKKVI